MAVQDSLLSVMTPRFLACVVSQGLAMYIVGHLYDLVFVCNPDVFAFIWVEHCLPVLFPYLKLV